MILVSDGGSSDPVAAEHELRRLRAAGVRVHAIGIGSDDILQRYAPASRSIRDPREVGDALEALIEEELPG